MGRRLTRARVMREVGAGLRSARLAHGWSLTQLEMKSKVDKPRLSRYENGVIEPSISTLAHIARAYDLSLGQLFSDYVDV